MGYTRHGHHIPGTEKSEIPPQVFDCEGLVHCHTCKQEVAMRRVWKEDENNSIGITINGRNV